MPDSTATIAASYTTRWDTIRSVGADVGLFGFRLLPPDSCCSPADPNSDVQLNLPRAATHHSKGVRTSALAGPHAHRQPFATETLHLPSIAWLRMAVAATAGDEADYLAAALSHWTRGAAKEIIRSKTLSLDKEYTVCRFPDPLLCSPVQLSDE